MATRDLNTDMDLQSPSDLMPLVRTLEARGLCALHVARGDDGLWRATLETEAQYRDPAANIAALLAAVEELPEPAADSWRACTLREFNIGYDCGRQPHAFSQSLPVEILRGMSSLGATLRVTLYPEDEQQG